MKWTEPKVYAVKHKDARIRAESRSGGIFTALSDEVLKENGVVYGCVLTDTFQAVHIRAEDVQTRNLMRGSKYIQSKLGDTYKNVEADLKTGRKVLFSGVSCQVAGLRGFLGKEYPNLFCIDIVCHGVPSPEVWKEYLTWQEKKKSQKVAAADFRNKKDYGWRESIETLTMEDGTKVDSRVFSTLFYSHNILRPCCFECPYKAIMHPGDITIGDYWGIEKAAPEFDDNKGVSLVLVNNDLGASAFEQVKMKLDFKSTLIEDCLQLPLKAPCQRPESRDQFWTDFQTLDFSCVAKRYGGYGFMNVMRRKYGAVKMRLLHR